MKIVSNCRDEEVMHCDIECKLTQSILISERNKQKFTHVIRVLK